MKVSIIGSGNVATVLGRLVIKNNHTVTAIISRNIEHAKILAAEFNCNFADFTTAPDTSADIFIIAVADSALQDCLHFHIHDKLVVHTAGSVSKDILKSISVNYGVLYPLQSLRKEMNTIPDIPFLIDGNSEPVTAFIHDFANTLSTQVQITNDEDRIKLHAAAVLVSNFTNHLYALAEDFCQHEHVNFNMLKPLIFETALRIKDMSPTAVQTGPAVRKDIYTLDKHLRLLANYPKLRTTYMRLTDSIMNP